MTTYYADFDLGTGNNDGTDWTNAWKTMAAAVAAAPAAGSTILCRGTDTLAGAVTNALAGSEASGLIKWIGVDASGNNVGGTTRAVLNANGGAFAALIQTGIYNYYENFRFTGSGNNDGVSASADLCIWVNCSFDTNNQNGLDLSGGADNNTIFQCVVYGNSLFGIYCYNADRIFFSCIRDNVYDGIYGSVSGVIDGCIVYDNSRDGVAACRSFVINCVIDNNLVRGIEIGDYANCCITLIGNRITNQSGVGDKGVDCSARMALLAYNAFDGNKDHLSDDAKILDMSPTGTSTNSYLNEDAAGGGDTNQGYVSLTEGSEDYSTNYVSGTDPHIRRTAITIPVS